MDQEPHFYDLILNAFSRRSIPSDLLACGICLAIAIFAIYLPVLNASFLRIVLCLPLVMFLPGYALVVALFPGARDIDNVERVALSFGLTVAIDPLAGLVLNSTTWGIRLDSMVICLSILTILFCLVAQYRRARILPDERFFVPFREMWQAIAGEFTVKKGSSPTDRILTMILLIVIVAAALTTIYVLAVPKDGEKYTEFFILSQDQKANRYPTYLVTGSNNSVFVGITNHESRAVNYTVESYFIDMAADNSTNTGTLGAMVPLDRFTVQVPDNQTAINPYSFIAGSSSYNRLEFLLFNETLPGDQVTGLERINSSYQNLHLMVTIVPG